VLDGGIGSVLVQRGIRWRDHGLRFDRERVLELHQEYVRAGVHVLRTNTFQLNRRVYRNVFRDEAHMRHIGAPDLAERLPTLIAEAVGVARESVGRADVAIAGVMSPLEHCFRPDLAPPADEASAEHTEIAALLADAGVDLMLLEAMNTVAETRCAIAAAVRTGLPVWVAFGVDANGALLSGESLREAAEVARDMGVEAVLVCGAPPEDVSHGLDVVVRTQAQMAQRAERFEQAVAGAFANVGWFDPPSWKFEFFPQFTATDAWPPARYAVQASAWMARGARIIGGGSGTSPDHVRMIAESVET
jgi:S-methylmethionine-dependent homocysteine/selenocysteine methylase